MMRWQPSRSGMALLIAIVGMVGTTRRAVVQGPPSGVEILSVATEKCLDVLDGSRDAGASVQQVRCHGGVGQRWRAHAAALSGHVYFQNDHSGLCLDVRQGGPADGTLQQYGCHYRDNQLFRFESGSATGGARIVVRSSGQCLDVPGGDSRDNLTIQQWPCHGSPNQRWIYAEAGRYRYPLVVSPIARLDFLLQEGRVYRFELREFAVGGAPVLHLWSDRSGAVAFNTGSPPPVSRLTYKVPARGGGVYRLFAHAAPSTGPGTGALTVFEDNHVLQMRANVPFGGTVVDALPSTTLQPYTYETALATDGVGDPYLLALDGSGRLVAHDDNGGVGPNARIADVVGVASVVIGSIDTTGAVTLLVNDAFRDQDGDGLGYGLERELGTCDVRQARTLCTTLHNLHDTDRDGLTDAAETLGLEGTPPMHLARWGANPLHKDVFVEVDYTTCYARMPLTEADAEAIRDFFSVGPAADLRNPDGRDGVSIHLDVGFEATAVANRTLLGNWGGSSRIPKDHPKVWSFRRAERGNVFFHGVVHVGGQGNGGDGFGAGLLNATGSCDDGIVVRPGNARRNVRTFVHELGHALNLEHEGGTGERPLGLNCSPIYPSIMNYADDAWGDVGFANGTEYPGVLLNPASLCEAAGLGTLNSQTHLPAFGLSPQGTAVDWNRDGVIQSCAEPVRGRVNWYPPQGCGTHVHGDATPLVGGTSPSMARLGSQLYLFYIDESSHLRYIWGRQGTAWPTGGCPHGFAGQHDPPCSDWSAPTATPETALASSVRAFAVDGRMYVTYTRPARQSIHVLIAERVEASGALGGWRPQTTIPGSRVNSAPALGLVYEQGFRGRVSRLLVALWPNRFTDQIEGAHIDLATSPTTFLTRASTQDAQGNPIATNGVSPTLAFWGRDDGLNVATNQTWMVVADIDSRIALYQYDAASTRWRNMSTAFVPGRATGTVERRIGFAYRPLLDGHGQVLDPLKGEFTIAYAATDEGGVGSIWISDVVDGSLPPDQSLRIPRALAGRLGHPWYDMARTPDGGVDLFADPGFPFLRGAVVRSDGRISFLPHADGIFDRQFRASSDFQVMERGICLRLHDRNADFCGPQNVFGY